MIISSSGMTLSGYDYSMGGFCPSGSGEIDGACSEASSHTAPGTDTVSLSSEARKTGTPADELTPEEKQQVAELKQRDREVKAHEAAHIAAGAGVVRGGATFSYQSGPDGKRYAVGGEVSIDTSGGNTPEETIRKMQTVRKAALAPASPSGTDRSVAAAAAAKEAQARQELNAQRAEELTESRKGNKQKPAISGNYNSAKKIAPKPQKSAAIDLIA